MAPLRISFLIRFVYDLLPSNANLVRWGKKDDPTCPLCQASAYLSITLMPDSACLSITLMPASTYLSITLMPASAYLSITLMPASNYLYYSDASLCLSFHNSDVSL
ncbi:reverse transcriptase [Plakobranchus ocellatus]|uniref:Reverse transcriptase n=1 Tax=Plakobranchus ocellatus TaxID=259542 RepID=A0AAV3ZNJ6_9GAST|nr:reverse transcriptase [Plakobranchus ocellatus]